MYQYEIKDRERKKKLIQQISALFSKIDINMKTSDEAIRFRLCASDIPIMEDNLRQLKKVIDSLGIPESAKTNPEIQTLNYYRYRLQDIRRKCRYD